MSDKELLEEVRKIVSGLPLRGSESEKAKAINQIKLLLLAPNDPYIRPCPMCGHPINVGPGEHGTHVLTGYRGPHIRPYLPGSLYWREEQEDGVRSGL